MTPVLVLKCNVFAKITRFSAKTGFLNSIQLAFLILFLTSFLPSLTLGAELAEIERRGSLIVAVKDNLRPMGFRDSEGALQGLEIEIARRLAVELLGNEEAIVFKPVSNEERIPMVIEGDVDIAIARLTFTPSRSQIINFSRYYYLDGTGLVTKNPSIQDFQDLEFSKIAVLNYSNTIAVIEHALPKGQLIAVESYQEALTLLESGEVEAFAADNSVLTGWIQEYPQYQQVVVPFSTQPLCIVLPKGLQYSPLYRRINEAIARWQESGWLQERINYWGLP